MPREVKAYLCKFRCGRKSDTKRIRMVEHEARCRKNPARRACPTCKNEINDPDFGYYCEMEHIEDNHIQYDCEFWVKRVNE